MLLLGFLILWWGALTLLLMVVIPDFLHRITFPNQAGWYGGGWAIIPFYALVSIPVFPMFSRLDDRIEQRWRQDTSGDRSTRLHD